MDTWAVLVLAIVSKVSMNIPAQTFLWAYTFIYPAQILRSGSAQSQALFLLTIFQVLYKNSKRALYALTQGAIILKETQHNKCTNISILRYVQKKGSKHKTLKTAGEAPKKH